MIDHLEEFKQILIATTLLSNSYSVEWEKNANDIIDFMTTAFGIKDESDIIKKIITKEISNLSLVKEYNGIKSRRDYKIEYSDEDILYDIKGKILVSINNIGKNLTNHSSLLAEEFNYNDYSTYNPNNRFWVILRAASYGSVILTRQIAIMYALGIGCQQDYSFAILRLKQAAFWGDTTSMKLLSYILKLTNNDEKAKIYSELYNLSLKYLYDGVTVLPDEDKGKYSEECRLYFTYISSILQDIIINLNCPNINFSFLEAIFSDKPFSDKMRYINEFQKGDWKEVTNASCKPLKNFGFIK